MHGYRRAALLVLVVTGGLLIGCGEGATIFNPSFANYVTGGIVPLVPGPASGFVLLRVNNLTEQNIEFVVTVEREVEVVVETEEGAATGVQEVSTVIESDTFRLLTLSVPLANEVGILLECPVTRVGLGEDLDRPTEDAGLFIGSAQGGVVQGFGVPANMMPLDSREGNFVCGDTLIFEAATSSGNVGSVRVRSFLLSAADQPSEVIGPDTFNNARALLESQRGEDEE